MFHLVAFRAAANGEVVQPSAAAVAKFGADLNERKRAREDLFKDSKLC